MKITERIQYQVTAAFIRRGNEFLITQRRDNDVFGGLWEFPGGKQEIGETLEECLVREIYEELNLQIAVQKYLFTVEHNYKEVKIFLHVFYCQLVDGTPECREVKNWKWVDFSTVLNFKFSAADDKVIVRLGEYF